MGTPAGTLLPKMGPVLVPPGSPRRSGEEESRAPQEPPQCPGRGGARGSALLEGLPGGRGVVAEGDSGKPSPNSPGEREGRTAGMQRCHPCSRDRGMGAHPCVGGGGEISTGGLAQQRGPVLWESPPSQEERPWQLSSAAFPGEVNPRLSRSCAGTRAALTSRPRLHRAAEPGTERGQPRQSRPHPRKGQTPSRGAGRLPHPGAVGISRTGPRCPRRAQPLRLFIPCHPPAPARAAPAAKKIPAGAGKRKSPFPGWLRADDNKPKASAPSLPVLPGAFGAL